MPGGTTEKRISALLRTPLPSDTVVKTPISRSYMLHPLVTGGLFQPEDFEIQPLQPMCEEASGVCPLAINDGVDLIKKFQSARHMKVYEMKGRLGRSTLDHSEKGKIIEKTSFHHISQYKIDKVLSKLVSVSMKSAFSYAGVHLQSQKAYELASKGALRPSEDSPPILYGLKCTNFSLPYFTLEVQCVNEDDWYLKNFMHELGLLLRSGAAYSKIRKVRHGHFTLKEALLSKHWSFEHIAQNLVICGQHNSDTKLLHQSHIGQKKLTTATNRDYLEFYPAETEFLPDAEEIQHFKRLCSGEDKEAQNEVISDKDHLYLTS